VNFLFLKIATCVFVSPLSNLSGVAHRIGLKKRAPRSWLVGVVLEIPSVFNTSVFDDLFRVAITEHHWRMFRVIDYDFSFDGSIVW
jgi:hypothetical protein